MIDSDVLSHRKIEHLARKLKSTFSQKLIEMKVDRILLEKQTQVSKLFMDQTIQFCKSIDEL